MQSQPWRIGMHLWKPYDISELVGILKYHVFPLENTSCPEHCQKLAATHLVGEEISLKNFVVEGSEEVPSFDCGFKFEFVHYLTGFIQQAIAPFYL
jgi:hypothetical protein